MLAAERDELKARAAAFEQEVGAKEAELALVRQAQAGQQLAEETRRTQMLELRGTPDRRSSAGGEDPA